MKILIIKKISIFLKYILKINFKTIILINIYFTRFDSTICKYCIWKIKYIILKINKLKADKKIW